MKRKQAAREGRVCLELGSAPPTASPRSLHCPDAQGPGALEVWAGQGWASGSGGVYVPNLARGKEGLHFNPPCTQGTSLPRWLPTP